MHLLVNENLVVHILDLVKRFILSFLPQFIDIRFWFKFRRLFFVKVQNRLIIRFELLYHLSVVLRELIHNFVFDLCCGHSVSPFEII